LATSNGYTEHFLAVIDVAVGKVVERVPIFVPRRADRRKKTR
jgi:hypothetical protein